MLTMWSTGKANRLPCKRCDQKICEHCRCQGCKHCEELHRDDAAVGNCTSTTTGFRTLCNECGKQHKLKLALIATNTEYTSLPVRTKIRRTKDVSAAPPVRASVPTVASLPAPLFYSMYPFMAPPMTQQSMIMARMLPMETLSSYYMNPNPLGMAYCIDPVTLPPYLPSARGFVQPTFLQGLTQAVPPITSPVTAATNKDSNSVSQPNIENNL